MPGNELGTAALPLFVPDAVGVLVEGVAEIAQTLFLGAAVNGRRSRLSLTALCGFALGQGCFQPGDQGLAGGKLPVGVSSARLSPESMTRPARYRALW